jgi:hypothetical protein
VDVLIQWNPRQGDPDEGLDDAERHGAGRTRTKTSGWRRSVSPMTGGGKATTTPCDRSCA